MSEKGFFFFLLLACLCACGCGLSQKELEKTGNNQLTDTEKSDPLLSFTVTASDGPLQKALLSLASIRNGKISEMVRSDENGQAVLNVRRSVLQGLESYDMLYLSAASDEKTTVQTASGQVNLQVGQSGLKSYLGTVSSVMTKIPFHTELCQDEGLQGKCVISHFNTARAVLSERQMRSENILSEPVTPKLPQTAFNAYGSQRMRSYADYMENTLDSTDHVFTSKFIFLAVAIKAQTELSHTNFLAGGGNYALNQPHQLFEEIAANYISPVHPSFTAIFPQVHHAIRQDLALPVHQKSFRSTAQSTGLAQISGQVVIDSAQKPVLIPLPDENEISMSEAQFLQKPFFRIRNRQMSSDGIGPVRIMPSLPPIGTTTCFQEFL